MAEPTLSPTDEQLLDWHFDNWARWMRRGKDSKGYPGRACGCTSWGDAWDDDAVFDRMDAAKAACVNTLVNDLPPAQRAAICHRYLDAVYHFPRRNYDQALASGRTAVAKGLQSRAMW